MNISFTPILANLYGMQGLVIFMILLLMFGAKRLPELAKGLGQAIREFSKAKNEIHDEITRETPPSPARQIETPAQPAQSAGTQPAPATQTVAQTTTVPHDHV